MAGSKAAGEELLAPTEWLRRLAGALISDRCLLETYDIEFPKPSNRGGLRRRSTRAPRVSARARTRNERREQAVPVIDEVPSPEQLVVRAQIQQKVGQLVLELPEPLRSTLLLRFLADVSAIKIARVQRIPVATVRSRLENALDRIRATLDKEHGNSRRAWVSLLTPLAPRCSTAPQP